MNNKKEQKNNVVKLTQIAAMFGLDARIALAIFGALSVITGAALYKSIEKTQVVAIVADFDNYAKAYESYLIDTGRELPYFDYPSRKELNGRELITSIEAGWKGPYLQTGEKGMYDNTSPAFKYKFLSAWYARLPEVSTFGSYTDKDAEEIVCANKMGGPKCFNWIAIAKVPLNLAKAIDLFVDGKLGANDGKVRIRVSANPSVDKYAVYYKIMATLKQN